MVSIDLLSDFGSIPARTYQGSHDQCIVPLYQLAVTDIYMTFAGNLTQNPARDILLEKSRRMTNIVGKTINATMDEIIRSP